MKAEERDGNHDLLRPCDLLLQAGLLPAGNAIFCTKMSALTPRRGGRRPKSIVGRVPGDVTQ